MYIYVAVKICVSNFGIIETQKICIIMIVVHLDTGTFIRGLAVNFSYCVRNALICETINVIIDIEIS